MSTSIIEFLLGKLFIYFILGIITCSLVEMVLIFFRTRPKILKNWLLVTFDRSVQLPDGNRISLGQAIADHAAITALSGRGGIPSYINAKNFANALIEKITYNVDDPQNVDNKIDEIIIALKNTPILSTELKRIFLSFAYEAKENNSGVIISYVNEIKYFRTEIENWFNTSMNSLTGAFKIKYARPLTFLMATLIVCALNVDSILFVKLLYSNSSEPVKKIEPHIGNSADSALLSSIDLLKPSSKTDSIIIEGIRNQLKADIKKSAEQTIEKQRMEEAQSFSIGWNAEQLKKNGTYSISKIVEKIVGLLATILIVILLAPFMFDLGNKYSNTRGTGPKPASTVDG